MGKKIDLHTHTAELEEDESILKFFWECMEQGVEIVSITDHKTLRAYTDKIAKLTPEEIKQIDPNLKIVVGIEMTGLFEFTNCAGQTHKIPIDILGYNLNLKNARKLDEWVKNHYLETDSEEYQKKELEELIKIAQELGYEADYGEMCIDAKDPDKKFAGRVLAQGLINTKYVEANKEKGLSQSVIENYRCFYNQYCKDPDSPFYRDHSELMPAIEDVIKIIQECGGLVFIPHIGAYNSKTGNNAQGEGAIEDSKKLAEDILCRLRSAVSGLEIIHPMNCALNNGEFVNYLVELANDNQLNVSGGTDYHRTGERIGEVPKGQPITSNRLPGLEQWAKMYTIQQIQNLVRAIPDSER